jgi:hypothetical protein
LILVLIGINIGGAAFSSAAASNISGKVMCISGDGVVGVWIDAKNGGSGWAKWIPTNGFPQQASFSFTLPKGGIYSVHVGCGGSPAKWRSDNRSSYGLVRDFWCYDLKGQARYGTCS